MTTQQAPEQASQQPATRPWRNRPWRKTKLTIRGYRSHEAQMHEILRHGKVKRSGLTPLSPWTAANMNQSTDKDTFRYKWEAFQGEWFGHTTAKLRIMEAMAAYTEIKDSTLPVHDCLIHPLYVQDNWEHNPPRHLPLFEVGHGQPGLWEARNPVVWKILEPSLRLASLFLGEAHLSTWWDALVLGEYKNRPPTEKYPEGERLSFHPRPEEEALRDRDKLRLFFSTFLPRYVNLRIHPSGVQMLDGIPALYDKGESFDPTTRDFASIGHTRQESTFGCTQGDDTRDTTWICINIETLEPLLRQDLTTTERLLEQFHIASVIFHETAHAVWNVISEYRPEVETGSDEVEPCYEDETLDELGNSLEMQVFNGTYDRIGVGDIHEMSMGLRYGPWPSINDYSTSGDKLDPEHCPKDMLIDSQYPVAMMYIENVWDANFWNYYVPVYGQSALHFNAATFGVQSTHGKDGVEIIMHGLNVIVMSHVPSVVELEAAQYAHKRIQAANRIKAEINTIDEEETKLKEKADPSLVVVKKKIGQGRGGASDSETEEYAIPQPPARYNQMRQWFLDNRVILRFETQMGRSISAHQLRVYCNKLSTSINLTEKEFSLFMRYCHYKQDLFDYHPIRPGLVKYRQTGWPSEIRRRLRIPDMRAYLLYSGDLNKFMEEWQELFVDNYPDYDIELVRQFYNRCAPDEGLPMIPQKEWVEMIMSCFYKKEHWRPGPPGIVRWRDTTDVGKDEWDEYDETGTEAAWMVYDYHKKG